MLTRRTLEFLPTVFQTETNKKFLNATVDQLIQEPAMIRMSNYIGRAEGSAVYKEGDAYLQEGSAISQYYQLEPSLIVRKRVPGIENEYNVDNVYNYVDFLNKIAAMGGINNNHDRLFNQEYYNYQGFVSIEKLVNYNQYYWVPYGPDAVNVNAGALETSKTFSVSRPTIVDLDPTLSTIVTGLPSYNFSSFDTDSNPTITLVRGGEYKFSVNQTGYPFYIQTAPGIESASEFQQNISKRDVKGVGNNGATNGIITFNVPKKTAQDQFINMPIFDTVDLVLDIPFKEVQNTLITTLLEKYNFDGVRLDQIVKRVIFTDTLDSNWIEQGNFDNDDFPYDTSNFELGSEIPKEKRKGIWELTIDEDGLINCSYISDWSANTKIFVREGRGYGNRYVYKNAVLDIGLVENITASLDTFYYQDGVDIDVFGIIKIVDPDPLSVLTVTDIVGKKNYTSPNGIKFTNGLKVRFTNLIEPENFKDREYIVEGVGTGIKLMPWVDFVTPEQYTLNQGSGFDASGEFFDAISFDNSANAPINKEYITINRGSADGNAWSRGNRWFHKSVLDYSASILTPDGTYDFNENNRAKRPIIEFNPNLILFNSGYRFLSTVMLIDTVTTDALSQIEGQSIYYVDGVELNNNQVVVFANDADPEIRSTIYRVEKISPNGSNLQIHLVPINTAIDYDSIVVVSGTTKQGLFYYWSADQNKWIEGQQKTFSNQEPLFDIIDRNNISFGNSNVYPSSNFQGSKLFSYKRSSSTDPELGFGITYRTIGNIGDILFENNFDTDTFNYNLNNEDVAKSINDGNVEKYVNGIISKVNPWIDVNDKSAQFVEKKFTATLNLRNDFDLRVVYANSLTEKNIFVQVNGQQITDFQLLNNSIISLLRFPTALAVGDKLVVKVYGNSLEARPLYTIPKNLEKNSLNETFDSITLGQMREHLIEMSRNSLDFAGEPAGNNNFRDINYLTVGGSILQHSAGFPLAQLFFNNSSTNVIDAIEYSKNEYARFKEDLFSILESTQFSDITDPRAILDEIMQEVTSLADPSKPFYYSDMMPFGRDYIKTLYTVFNTADKTYNTVNLYEYAQGKNFYADVLVYVNGTQVINNKDYTIADRTVSFAETYVFSVDDVIEIYEYTSTLGCMIPATPSKLGMYPAYVPEKYLDNTIIDETVESKYVIQGHDGSITLAFNDFRDDVILEFEKRIYNNIHIDYLYSLPDFRVAEPGAFRETDYSFDEWTQLLSRNYLEWTGKNNIDLYSNNTTSNNLFSLNYSEAKDKLFNQLLPGYWRGIYKYFYDTDRPHTHPWEMGGYSVKPSWWETYYGPAPYTSGNLVLWEDMEAGVYYENGERLIDPPYIRPGLTSVIPVDEHGNLLPPQTAVIQLYNSQSSGKNWRFGDHGPQETAWRRSSDYPFAVMVAYALAKPVEFCNYTFNLRDYVRDAVRDQNLAQIINVATNSRKVNSNISNDTDNIPGTNIFIRDRLANLGLDINENFVYLLEDLTINLAYKLGGFSDKKYLQVLAEQSSPQSKNTSVLIPPEDYELVLTKSAPISRASLSAVIVEKLSDGYAVRGYDTLKPYFVIIPSVLNSSNYSISIGNARVVIYNEADTRLLQIPYGTKFNTKQQVADFLVSYGRYLTRQGFIFDQVTADESTRADWTLAVKEFLYFTQQGWDETTVLSLSPIGGTIKFDNFISVVENLINPSSQTRIIDNNGNSLRPKDYRVYREGTQFELKLKDTNSSIAFIDLEAVQIEHTLIFNNVTVFNDVVYQNVLGNRQQRLKLIGRKTKDWDGSLYAPGFLINHKPVEFWAAQKDYYKGDTVKFKNRFYTAVNFVPGKQIFDQNDWYQIENTLLAQKLIPTPAFNASQFEHFYDVDTVDINVSADSQARHSTGFQPRSYFTDIGLDVVSQHKFYLGMIREKGTNSVIDKFLRAKLPYLENNVTVTEEWALKSGSYGNIENKNTLDISLKNVSSTNNTIILELLNKNDVRSSQWNTVKSIDLLTVPSNFNKNIFSESTAIPKVYATTGQVQLKEIAATVFDVNKISNINPIASKLGEGSRIWVASDVDNDWNVYRANNDYGLKAVSIIPFSDREVEIRTLVPHGFRSRDKILIKNLVLNLNSGRTDFSGIYRVTVANEKAFRIDLANLDFNGDRTPTTISSLIFKLQSVKYNSRKDFANNTPYRGWKNGDVAYIQDVAGKWQVLTNYNSWIFRETQNSITATANDNYGKQIVLTTDQKSLILSSQEDNGKVYLYGKDEFNNWDEIEFINYDQADEFGYNIAANNTKIVVGAPGTNSEQGAVFIYDLAYGASTASQIIYDQVLSAGSRLGHTVAVSDNGKWLYVNASNEEEIYAYKLITVESDDQLHTADGSTTTFLIPASVSTLGLYADQIKVFVDNKILIPFIDYDMNISQTAVVLTTVPVDNSNVKIEYSDYYIYVDTIANPGVSNNFGKAIKTSTDGRDIIVSAHTNDKTINNTVYSALGSVYYFRRTAESFIADGVDSEFTTYYTGLYPNILVDDVLLSEDTWVDSLGITYSLDEVPDTSAIVTIETNNFILLEELTATVPQDNLEYGHDIIICPNNCSVYVGAPGYRSLGNTNGAVYRHVNVGRLYGKLTGSVANPTVSVGNKIRINDFQITLTGTSLDSVVSNINSAGIPGVSASKTFEGYLTVVTDSTLTFNKLKITNDFGTALTDLGLELFPEVQIIESTYQENGLRFGEQLSINAAASKLMVGTTKASSNLDMTLDGNTLTFDSKSTLFKDTVARSGAAYLYEYQSSNSETPENIGQFAYAAKFTKSTLKSNDAFGTGVALGNNWAFITSPKGDVNGVDKGTLDIFYNANALDVWSVTRQQAETANSNKLTRAFIYNEKTNVIEIELPVVDSIAGKHLPEIYDSIRYTTNYDPAVYNAVPSDQSFTLDRKNAWGKEYVGTLWWDTNAIKYFDWNQGNLFSKAITRDILFPSSSVDIYQWVESNVPPASFNELNVLNGLSSLYTVNEVYSQFIENDNNDEPKNKYYFWAKLNRTATDRFSSNTLVQTLTSSLNNPRNAGKSYVSVIAPNAISLYNCENFIGGDHVLKIEYSKNTDTLPIHNEWALFPDKSQLSVPIEIYDKIVDSIAGEDVTGRLVPDPVLKIKQQYGLEARPRQSVFNDNDVAKKLFVDYINDIFQRYPITLIRNIDELSAADPFPLENQFDETVENDIELSYLQKELYINKEILVKLDSLTGGWTIRKLENIAIGVTDWVVVKSQKYNNQSYWTYSDWYADGYSSNFVPTHQVDFAYEITDLLIKNNDTIKINNSVAGGFQLVRFTNNTLELIGQEAATIQFSSALYDTRIGGFGIDDRSFESTGFGKDSAIELRNIFKAVTNILTQNAGVFVDEFRNFYKALFVQYIDLIATQFIEADWLFKTSFISINHQIRSLDQIPVYVKQPEQIIENYINEVKPYHAKIREYLSSYPGKDNADISLTDFDLPPYFDQITGKFKSPNINDDRDLFKFAEAPWNTWLDNYEYELGSVDILDGGTGYTNDTVLIIDGGATARVKVRANGIIYAVIIENSGSGYISPPSIEIQGIGNGAILIAKLQNKKVRTVKSYLKFDRYTRALAINEWQSNYSYNVDDVFTYNFVPYRVITAFISSTTIDLLNVVEFIVRNWESNVKYSAYDIIVFDKANKEYYDVLEDFTSGSLFDDKYLTSYNGEIYDNAIDRTWSYYNPSPGMPGRSLLQLIKGLEYPGVGVIGPTFDQEPGFGVANFDSELFDAREVSAEGVTTLSGASSLDTAIYSYFNDNNLGIRAEDIIHDGAGFVDIYNSHAPEELIPGRIFDSLNIKVTHGPQDNAVSAPQIKIISYNGNNQSTFTFNFDIIGTVEKLIVYTAETGFLKEGIDFSINWYNKTITTDIAIADNDIIYIMNFGSTGENIIADLEFYGDGSTASFALSDVNDDLANQFYVKINGIEVDAYTATTDNYGNYTVTFDNAPGINDYIQIHAFAADNIRKAYSSIKEINYTVAGNTVGESVSFPSQYVFELPELMQYVQPWNSYVSVRLNGDELVPANNKYYIGDGSSLTYTIPSTNLSNDAVISDNDIIITVDDILQKINIDYLLLRDGSSLPVVQFTTAPGDNSKIIISDYSVSDYRVIDNSSILVKEKLNINQGENTDLKVGDIVTITMFSNHDMYDIRTEVFVGLLSTSSVSGGFDAVGFDAVGFDSDIVTVVTTPTYIISRPVENPNYIQIFRNGGLLLPYEDYIIYDGNRIELNSNLGVSETDIVYIRSFSEQIRDPIIKFRIFKNMNNDFEYLGIGAQNQTTLSQDLNIIDTVIHVVDASKLPQPGVEANQPGVVFINGERIIYWAKNNTNNTLSLIRRSTAGTGAPAVHLKGTVLEDGSVNMYVPNGDKLWYNLIQGGQAGEDGSTLFAETDGTGLQNSTSNAADFLKSISR